jgi:predicted TIM-barrel fold metal-dependent hydrolase
MGVPVFLHHSAQTGEPHLAPMKFCRPWLFDEVAADFQGVTFVLEHMSWPWTQELFALMSHCLNVWTDISMLTCRPHVLAWNLTMARDYGLLDRVVWGTDYLGNSVDEWASVVAKDVEWLRGGLNAIMRSCGWPELCDSELDGILCGNARRLFRLSE